MGNNSTIEKLSKKLRTQRVYSILLLFCIPIVVWGTSLYFNDAVVSKSKHSMLDPLREFTPAENYVTNIQPLREYLEVLEDRYPDSISIYYENINSGSNISINKDLRLFPASLSKLVQAILITYKVEKGQLEWDQMLEVTHADLSADSGDLYQKGVGQYTVETLLKELLVHSDNTAQNVFKRYLTFTEYSTFQDETGLQDLYNEKGFISAKEYTRILRVLYTSSFLLPENSEKILNYMAESTFRDYLSQGIPGHILFAHKYGENREYNIFADSGIVYVVGKPYMLTVIIKGKDSSEATRTWVTSLMKEISEHAYETSK